MPPAASRPHPTAENRRAHDDQTGAPARRDQSAENPPVDEHAKLPAVTPPAVGPAGTNTPSRRRPKSQATRPVGEAHSPNALLLDTNAASTYNPYNYTAANFGDPSLAIDGDTSTGWTALVEPAVAPKMAEGLLIDLNTPRKLVGVALDHDRLPA